MDRFRQGRSALIAVAAVVAGAAGLSAAPARAAVTVVVDDDGKATAANCGAATPAASTVAAGVAAAAPGDTVKVCPGTYTESVVTVDKTISLVGAKAGVNGFTRVFKPATESIIATANSTVNALDIKANGVTVDGFTFQHSNVGVWTSNANSGYVIRNNIFRNNVMGMYMGSSGSSPSLVTQNKFIANNVTGSSSGNGIYSDSGVSNATISGNWFGLNRNSAVWFQNCIGGVNSNIDITSNTFNNNYTALTIYDNNTGFTIDQNTTSDDYAADDLQFSTQFFVGGNATNIVIGGPGTGNTMTNSPWNSIAVRDTSFCAAAATLPTGGVSIVSNDISNSANNGIDITTVVPARVDINNNVLINNGQPRPDLSHPGADGILLDAGTSGNTISFNSVTGSGILDCEDNTTGGTAGPPLWTTQNSWMFNAGGTDDPDGICPPPT
jgi:hypothetical protein